jgi:hypothetical protein
LRRNRVMGNLQYRSEIETAIIDLEWRTIESRDQRLKTIRGFMLDIYRKSIFSLNLFTRCLNKNWKLENWKVQETVQKEASLKLFLSQIDRLFISYDGQPPPADRKPGIW